MNERIRELLVEAARATNEDPNGEYPADMMEKFAELIWKEAYEQGYDKGMSDGQCGCGV